MALYRHPAIKEAAVLAFPDDDGVPIKAFTSTRDGSKLSIIELKKFCSENLPLYMVPDLFCSPRVVAENFDGQGRLPEAQKYEMRSETAEQSASAQHLLSFFQRLWRMLRFCSGLSQTDGRYD